MTDLPPGWARAKLGDVSDVASGSTPKTGISEYWGGDIAWLTPDDLSKDRRKVVGGGARMLTQAGYDSCSTRLLPPGSVVFSSRAPVGYVAIAGAPLCTNQGCKSAVPPIGLDSDYLYWYLRWRTPEIESRASGTTFREVSSRAFAETELLLPPLAEQRRIVEVLEDHLSRLDAAQGQLAAALLRCRVLRDAAVAALVQGRDDWERHAIGSLLREPLRNGHSAPATADGRGIRALTITAVTVDDFSDANTKVTSADRARVRDLWLEPGDILVQRSNTPELVGTTAMYDGPRDWAIFPDLLIRLRPCDRLLPEFLTAVLRSAPVRRHFRSKAKGLAGSMPKIDQPTIMSTVTPVPSISEQRRVLETYRRWNEKIDRLRTALEEADRRAVHLRASLLRQAFSGRLVPQDPSDEPATALLDRLNAERAAAPKSARRRARTS